MPQLQPEPEQHQPRPRHVTRSPPSEELLEWSPNPTPEELLEWSPNPVNASEEEAESPKPSNGEPKDEPPDDPAEERRRARHTASFAGCILGGAASLVAQLIRDGGGDELLIHGAGIWLARDHPQDPLPRLRSKPVLYCNPSLVGGAEGRPVLVREHRSLIRYLGFVTGGEQPPMELIAIGTEAAVEDWAPGSMINGSQPGKLGAPCTLNGVPSILTAGHVTNGQSTVSYPAGSSQANVKLEYHAGSNPQPLAVGPDFAVIELPAGQGRSPALTPRTTRVGPSEALGLLGGGTQGRVLALATFLRVQTRPGCWGDVYQLDVSIGGPGDSGAAVIDSAGALAGHYLGRLGNMAVVQDISYQVSELTKAGVTIP